MTVLVLDTSALVEFVVGSDALAERVRTRTAGCRPAAPHAVDLECASVLRRPAHAKKLPEEEALRAIDLLGRMQPHR